MNISAIAVDPVGVPHADQLDVLLHQLNNQLGIVLAHAELLDTEAADPASRARVDQVVKSVLAAMGTAREIRRRSEPPTATG